MEGELQRPVLQQRHQRTAKVEGADPEVRAPEGPRERHAQGPDVGVEGQERGAGRGRRHGVRQLLPQDVDGGLSGDVEHLAAAAGGVEASAEAGASVDQHLPRARRPRTLAGWPPAEGGPNIVKRKSSWHRRRRSKSLAVSLRHWKGRGGGNPLLLRRCTV